MRPAIFSKILMLTIFISVFSLSVTAQFANDSGTFDVSDSYIWMIEHCEGGNCADNIMATSFYAMAMKMSGYSDSYGSQAVNYIISKEDGSLNCFPNNNCNVRDTAFAVWTLSNYGLSSNEPQEYIRNLLKVGLKDNWWLEVITNAENKTCKIGYPSNGDLEESIIKVDQGKFPECNAGQPETYFDLNSCVPNQANLINNNPSIELTIDCSAIGPGTIIAIIYNSGSSYFVTSEATTSKYVTQIENACHPDFKDNPCNKDTSLWANWILYKQQSDILTNLWLLNNYDPLNVLDTSLLYLSTKDQKKKEKYLEDLKNLQKLDGSFNKDNFETAIAVLALQASASSQELADAIAYLKKSRNSDGFWSSGKYSDIMTTAAVLHSAFAGANVNLPPMSALPPSDITGFCGDGVCQPYESSFSCEQDCAKEPSQICVINGKCETALGENFANCPEDCPITIPEEPTEPAFEPEYEEEKEGFGWWIITIVVLLLLAAAYLAYNKFFKTKTKPKKAYAPTSRATTKGAPTTGFQGPYTRGVPPSRARHARGRSKTKTERELEKSLEEAKRLLGKK
tara:strand:+ start:8388 stop:10091 length:1704 start_codon:yes stop_codon:yes gene_type:complete